MEWFKRFRLWFLAEAEKARLRFKRTTPLGRVRIVMVGLLLLGGACLVGVLVFPGYDRALILTGRTEVVSMRLDNTAFGILSFDVAILRADLDTPAAARGPVQLDVALGTTIRFVRIGRGPMRLNFTAAPGALPDADCAAGLRAIGTVSVAGVASVLCEGASVLVPLSPGDDPLVVGMSGGLVVGEEITEGAGPRPIMLEATTTLWVRHSGAVFRGLCGWELLEHVCDRFVANSLVLSPGNSVRAFGHQPGHDADRRGAAGAHGAVTPADGDVRLAGLGFIRADPNEFQSGMMFSLAAPASAFQVTRLEGEAFTIKENLFEVIKESPLMRTLNVTTVTVGLLWYFLRLGEGRGSEVAGAALLCLCLASPASAEQAMLRADETGQALLRSRGDRCYAVTPAHVMGTDTSALVTAPGRERGEGDLLRRIPAAPEPIALLSLRGVPLSLCPAFEGAVSLDALLRDRVAASLRLVRSDGSIDRIPLMLAAVEVETVEVQTEAGVMLEQGMSGGTVLVADQPVGLLVDVLKDGRTGRVARLDRIFERLTPH